MSTYEKPYAGPIKDRVGHADLARLSELKCWPLTDKDYADARKVIAANAESAQECRELLEMLGLMP